MIKLEKITKTFKQGFIPKGVEVLKSLSLEVKPGEVYGFLGPNGAGKTTTIKILMNLIMPTGGRATIGGIDVADVRARQNVGYLPEQPYFYSYLTGSEFLDYCGKLCGMLLPDRAQRSLELLKSVGLENDKDKALQKYSRGMLQRIGIAQALINDPGILILDEPLSGLDPVGRRELIEIIFSEKNRGKTIFFSSHILTDAESICDRVGILNKGILVAEGELRKILEKECPAIRVDIDFLADRDFPFSAVSHFGEYSRLRENTFRLKIESGNQINTLLKTLIENGASIESVNRHRFSLEDLFLKKIM